MNIYKQASIWLCGNYAFLYGLEHLGVPVTEQQILALGSFMGIEGAENRLRRAWLIKSVQTLISPKIVDLWLKKWHWLPTKMIRNNFTSARTPPHIQDFKWTTWHFVCIVEDLWDRWKYRDEQWEQWWDKWHAYIMKKDFKFLTVCKINI